MIRRRIPADDESPDYERELPDPVFDPLALFEVVRLLPFEEGYSAAMETFNAEGMVTIPLTVTGRDEIDGAAVWVVRAVARGRPADRLRHRRGDARAGAGFVLAPARRRGPVRPRRRLIPDVPFSERPSAPAAEGRRRPCPTASPRWRYQATVSAQPSANVTRGW